MSISRLVPSEGLSGLHSADCGRHGRNLPGVTRSVLAIACACVFWGLNVGSSAAQNSGRQPMVPRRDSAMVAPEPPELVPHPARPYDSRSAYDPLPTHAVPRGRTPDVTGEPDISAPQFNLPDVRVDSLPPSGFALPEPGSEAPASQATAFAVDPMPMLQTINEELNTAAQRESSQFDSLQLGLQKLRQATESMRQRAQQDQKLLEAERRRARRAERLADDARQQAEQARIAAEQTLRRFEELNDAAAEPSTEFAPPVENNNPDPAAEGATSNPALPSPAAGIQPTSEPRLTSKSIVTSAVPITDDAVDRESLANNLFGAKQYQLALPIYAELAKTASGTEDELWYHYQLACCYRNLGNMPQAEKHYRVVAGRKDSYLAAMSRWYLSLIQEQTTLQEQMDHWELVLGRANSQRAAQEEHR